MANYVTNPGVGGVTFRSETYAGVEWAIGLVSFGPLGGPFVVVDVASGKGLPVQPDAGAVFPVSGTVGVSGSVAVTGTFWQATQPVSNAGTFAVQAAQSGTWDIGTVTTVTAVTAITNALPAGTNNIGDVDIETYEPSADVTMQSAATATGNGTVLSVTGYGTASIQITGTFVGTITFEGTANGTDWVSILVTQDSVAFIGTTATAPGIFRLSVAGLTSIRASVSAYTSGSITAVGRATNAPFGTKVVAISGSALPTGASTAANQSTIIGHVDGIEGLLGTIDADTGNISTKIDTLAGAVSGTEMQVDVLSSSLPTGAATSANQDVANAYLSQSKDYLFSISTASSTLSAAIRVDDSVYLSGTPAVNMAGFFFDDVAPDSVNEGDAGAARMSANRNVYMTIRDAAGNERGVNVSAGNALVVDGSAVTQPVSGTVGVSGTVAVTQSGTWDEVGVNDSGNSLTVDAPVGTPVFVRLSDGSAAITTLPVSLSSVPSHAVTNAGVFAVQATPGTSGGCTIFRSLDIDETEEEVKGTAGQVYCIHAMNMTAAPLFLKFYNATAANVTVGSTTPVMTFPVPGNGDSDGAGFVFSLPQGIAFGTAITVACTTGVADADTGAPAANACVIQVFYA